MYGVWTFGMVIGLLAVPSIVNAQEKKIGITMGYPASVGLLWHVTETVAIRPELSAAWSTGESAGSESDGFSIGTGVSVLFYAKKWESLSAYVTPRFSYSRTSGEFRSTSTLVPISLESTTTGNAYLVVGSFGAQYWLGSRFSAFGEVGIGYQHGTTRSRSSISTSESKTSSTTVGTRSAIGVVFYF